MTAVICGNRGSLEKVKELLGDEAPQVIYRNQALPEKGVFLITLDLVKGLEFDVVILLDPTEENYPSGEGDVGMKNTKLLYVAATRALHELHVLSSAAFTRLITD